MQMMKTANSAVVAATNALDACLLGQRVLQSALEVCLACAKQIKNFNAPDVGHIDLQIMGGHHELRAERRILLVHFCAHFADKTPVAARLRPGALRRSSRVMRRRPAHLETKGAAMPAQQASAEKVQLGIS